MWLAMYNFLYLLFPLEWTGMAEKNWQILGIFHSILHHILYYARVTVIKMQYRVNFLVDSLYYITI